jgi:hypothetical protein
MRSFEKPATQKLGDAFFGEKLSPCCVSAISTSESRHE